MERRRAVIAVLFLFLLASTLLPGAFSDGGAGVGRPGALACDAENLEASEDDGLLDGLLELTGLTADASILPVVSGQRVPLAEAPDLPPDGLARPIEHPPQLIVLL